WGLGGRETPLIPDQQKAAWGLGWRETSLIPDPPLGFSFPVACPAEQSGHLGFSRVAWARLFPPPLVCVCVCVCVFVCVYAADAPRDGTAYLIAGCWC